MPIAVADLVRIWSAEYLPILRSNLVYASHFNRLGQREINAGAYAAKIPYYKTTATSTDYSRGDDWKTPGATDVDLVEIALDQYKEYANSVRWPDGDQARLNLVQLSAQDAGESQSSAIDANLRDFMRSALNATATTLGTAANYIDVNGDASTAAAGKFPYTILRSIAQLGLKQKLTVTGRRRYPLRCTFTEGLWTALVDWTIDQKLSNEINRNAYVDASLPAPPGFVARVRGVDVLVSGDALDDYQISSKGYHVAIGGSTRAFARISGGGVQQSIPPEQNQTGPKHLIRRLDEFGRQTTELASAGVWYVRNET